MSRGPLTGAAAVCNTLQELGTTCVFGVPGTQNVELFEQLRKSRIRTVLATHELAASFMANGYYRASGQPAVLVTIPGPGFTYALTGLTEARLDSAAVLYLVGAPATRPGKHFQLQAIDQSAIASPIVKTVLTVNTPDGVSQAIHAAFARALAGEPGPVMVQIEASVLGAETSAQVQPSAPPSAERPDIAQELSRLFVQSERPILLLGQGAIASADVVRRLVDRHRIPVVTTLSARGILPENHPLACGFDVLRGRVDVVNRLFAESDLILAIGCKLSHNGSAGFQLRLPEDKLVHVDASEAVPGANYPARLRIVSSAEEIFALLDSLERKSASAWNDAQLQDARNQLRQGDQGMEPAINGAAASAFFAWLREALPDDAVVVTDSGFHQIMTRRHFEVRAPRGLIVPSDFQSMGFGLPAAIGARLAAPHRPVAALIGDGGFQMSGLELLTALREKLPLLVVVFNDGQLNQIRLQQLANFGYSHAVTLQNPDFALLAEALGAGYLRFGEGTPADLRTAMQGERPTLLEVPVGDSAVIRKTARINRVKAAGRQLLGSRLRRLIKRILARR